MLPISIAEFYRSLTQALDTVHVPVRVIADQHQDEGDTHGDGDRLIAANVYRWPVV